MFDYLPASSLEPTHSGMKLRTVRTDSKGIFLSEGRGGEKFTHRIHVYRVFQIFSEGMCAFKFLSFICWTISPSQTLPNSKSRP